MTTRGFAWPVRVYYEDTDAAGIVYHANYLRFMERARTEWLRALGFSQSTLAFDPGLVFVITHSDLHFVRPARFDQELEVHSTIKRLRRASLTFTQTIDDRRGVRYARADNTVACLDVADFSPRRLPPDMLRAFEREQ